MSLPSRAARLVAVLTLALGVAAPGLAAEAPTTGSVRPLAPAVLVEPVPSATTTTILSDDDSQVPEVALQAPDGPLPGDTVAYPTLAAAVAAQSTDHGEDAQLRCLASAIYFESRGEPLAGQLAVAQVILNRVASGRFAGSACSVITQRGQFGFVRGGRIPAVAENADYRRAVAVARVAMADAWDGAAEHALFFNTTRPSGAKIKVATIGNHRFYR